MIRRISCCSCAFFGLASLAAPASADAVKLYGKPAFRDVQIVAIEHDRIVFRGLTRELLRKPLDQVESLEVDEIPELALAERDRVADPVAAAAAYEKILKSETAPWLIDWVRVRSIETFERARRFDRAIQAFVPLVTAGRADAARFAPRRPAPPGDDANRRALQFLADVRALGGRSDGTLIRRLHLELLIYEDVAELPAEFAAALPATARPPAGELLFGTPAPTQADREVSLPLDSYVFTAAEHAFSTADYPRAIRLLQRALPFVRDADDRPLRLILGRAQLQSEQLVEAVETLSSLIDSVDLPELAGNALYYSGLAQERLGRPDVARRMYAELQIRPGVSEQQKQLAAEGLERVPE